MVVDGVELRGIDAVSLAMAHNVFWGAGNLVFVEKARHGHHYGFAKNSAGSGDGERLGLQRRPDPYRPPYACASSGSWARSGSDAGRSAGRSEGKASGIACNSRCLGLVVLSFGGIASPISSRS